MEKWIESATASKEGDFVQHNPGVILLESPFEPERGGESEGKHQSSQTGKETVREQHSVWVLKLIL